MAGTWIAKIVAVVALPLAVAAIAQQSTPAAEAEPEDEIICVGGFPWRASNADNRAIATDPVPADYRARYESPSYCVRYLLNEEGLVDWHLAAGNARSAGRALAYLESHHRRDIPAPDDFARALRVTWQSAQPDLDQARAIGPAPEQDGVARRRFMERSPTIQQLFRVLDGRESYLFLAEQYLRAAEEFGSSALLEKAEGLLRPAVEGDLFLAPLLNQPPIDGLLPFPYELDSFQSDDLQMRVALLRARLTPSPATLARAETVIAAFARPEFERVAAWAFTGGSQFCDIDARAPDRAEIAAACRDDDRLDERVTNYWVNRTILDMLKDAEDWSNEQLTARLLELGQSPYSGQRCCGRSSREDRLRLLLAGAEQHARRFRTQRRAGERSDALRAWFQALEHLEGAERLLAVHDEPGRFRRVARTWLSLWAQADRLDLPDGEGPHFALSARRYRYAAYLRRLLGGIDAIAVGSRPQGN